MSIIEDLEDMFPHIVLVAARTSSDGYGDRSFDVANERPLKCRISGRHRAIRDQEGEVVTSTMQVLFAGAFDVGVKDRYTLPSGFSPTLPTPIAVKRVPDEDGAHHERVFFK